MPKRLVLFLFLYSFAFSLDEYSGGRLSRYQKNMNVLSYAIHLNVNPENKTISGYVDIQLDVKDTLGRTIEFDLLDSYNVDGVYINGEQQRYIKKQNKVRINPNNLFVENHVRIHYNGSPPEAKNPPWGGGFTWEKDTLGFPWIGVSCQTNGAHIWFPCIEHPSDEANEAELFITVEKPLVVAANGILIDTVSTGGKTTWHWKTQYPISPYNINFTVGRFDIINKTIELKNPTRLQYFVLPEHKDGSNYIIDEAEKYLHFYEQYFGPYPWTSEKFGMVETPYWGMEHQTIIAYGNRYKVKEPGYDFLLLHEMGHEWWGNYLTVHDWADFWIHEGVTIYAEALFLEDEFGIDAYHEFFKKTVRQKISNKKPIVPKRNATSKDVDGLDVYYKGAMVLHMLRFLEGKEKILTILNRALYSDKELPYNHITTNDFIEITQNETDKDYSWFFDTYLFSKRIPKLVVKNKKVYWEKPSYPMPIEIELTNGKTIKHFPNKEPIPNLLKADPNGWILFRE